MHLHGWIIPWSNVVCPLFLEFILTLRFLSRPIYAVKVKKVRKLSLGWLMFIHLTAVPKGVTFPDKLRIAIKQERKYNMQRLKRATRID